MQHYAPPNIII